MDYTVTKTTLKEGGGGVGNVHVTFWVQSVNLFVVLDGEVRGGWWDDVHLLVIPGGIDDSLWRDNH